MYVCIYVCIVHVYDNKYICIKIYINMCIMIYA